MSRIINVLRALALHIDKVIREVFNLCIKNTLQNKNKNCKI